MMLFSLRKLDFSLLMSRFYEVPILLITNFGISLALVKDIILQWRSFDVRHNPSKTWGHFRVVSFYVIEVVVVTLGYTYSATPSFMISFMKRGYRMKKIVILLQVKWTGVFFWSGIWRHYNDNKLIERNTDEYLHNFHI